MATIGQKIELRTSKNGVEMFFAIDEESGKKIRISRKEAILPYAYQVREEYAARREANVEDYAVSIEAQKVAIDAEIATAEKTESDFTALEAAEQAVTFEREWNGAINALTGKPALGKRLWYVRTADGDWKRNKRSAEKKLAEFGFTFNSFEKALNARDEARRKNSPLARFKGSGLTLKEIKAILDAEEAALECAINADAQDTAIDAEIESANANELMQKFLAAKNEVGYKLNNGGAKIWYISYARYDMSGNLIGHTPALKRSREEANEYLVEEHGLTVEQYLATQEKWIEARIAESAAKMAIENQAEHLSDKIARDRKNYDDRENVFELLPETDELNDAEEEIATDAEIETATEANVEDTTVEDDREVWELLPDVGELNDADTEIEMANTTAETDDFNAQIAKLKAAYERAFTLAEEKREALRKAQEELDRAEEYAYETRRKFSELGNGKATELRDRLLDNQIFLAKNIKLIPQTGTAKRKPDISQIWINFDECNAKFTVTAWYTDLATYDTPAQVEHAINQLKAAIWRGDSEFSFPTVEDLTTPSPTPDEMLNMIDTLDQINANAPVGWHVEFNGKDFSVKYRDNRVTDIDSLALAKILSPDKFFDRFKPLTPYLDDDKPQFTDDLYREIDELCEMREQLTDDKERLKIIDDLINDAKRKILQSVLDFLEDDREPCEIDDSDICF